MSQRVLVRSIERIPKDPLAFWLSRLDPDSLTPARSGVNRWLAWLRRRPGFESVTARDMLVRQLQASDSYEVLDLAQEFIGSLVGCKSSKEKTFWAIRSFFMHNRCALPADPSFRIRGDRPPIEGRLTVPNIVEAYHAATIRYKSIIMFKWQSMLDNSRLIWMNRNKSDEIVRQIQQGIHPVRIDLPGRKENENDTAGRFCTFIGKDAIDALVKYFEEERGWPKPKEPIWVQSDGKPLHKPTMEATWLRLLRRMGKIPKRKGPQGSRYGYNLHEMRNVATTYLHVNAKGDGLDMDCIRLWCGQVGQIDPLKYDKFYKDIQYVTDQYKIAEQYLNIITGKPTSQRLEDQLKKKDIELALTNERLARLEGQFETIIRGKLAANET